jgi:hypothetical protein
MGGQRPVAVPTRTAGPAADKIIDPTPEIGTEFPTERAFGPHSARQIFWGGLVTVVVVLLHRFGHPGAGPARNADTILDERFARGEIDEEELKQRRTALHGKG